MSGQAVLRPWLVAVLLAAVLAGDLVGLVAVRGDGRPERAAVPMLDAVPSVPPTTEAPAPPPPPEVHGDEPSAVPGRPPDPPSPPGPSRPRSLEGTMADAAVARAFPTSTVAHAVVPEVPVFDAPGSARPVRVLGNPQPSGAPLVFLVREEQPGWLDVLLPVRPNGSSGWVRRDDVSLSQHDFGIIVELGARRITVLEGDRVIVRAPVGVGTRDTPTPGGLYYTKELLLPTDASGRYSPGGAYGPYAYGLSGFSNVLTSFAGGNGVIGIHGTNSPSSLGRSVSHGCIRVSNRAISFLARTLPLGVPVQIVA